MEQLSQQILRMEKKKTWLKFLQSLKHRIRRQAIVRSMSGYHHHWTEPPPLGIRPLLLYWNQAITILESGTVWLESGHSHMEKLGHHCNLTLDQNQATIIELNQVNITLEINHTTVTMELHWKPTKSDVTGCLRTQHFCVLALKRHAIWEVRSSRVSLTTYLTNSHPTWPLWQATRECGIALTS